MAIPHVVGCDVDIALQRQVAAKVAPPLVLKPVKRQIGPRLYLVIPGLASPSHAKEPRTKRIVDGALQAWTLAGRRPGFVPVDLPPHVSLSRQDDPPGIRCELYATPV